MTEIPLLPQAPGHTVLAYRQGAAVTRAQFLAHVFAVASQLPDTKTVVNLCADRYWFAVGLFAAISRNMVSLLPNSAAPQHIATVCADAWAMVCLHDQEKTALPWIACRRVDVLAATPPQHSGELDVPLIPVARHVLTVFTSGSTGTPQPHPKSFGRLHLGVAAACKRIWAVGGAPCSVLGTVPFRHMYGLDLTVLLPLLGGGTLCAALPFFPADVAQGLAQLPLPRLLVTTPFHLRKLLESQQPLPPLAALLSATAPLPPELARQAEQAWNAPVLEIFGSTETGQLAMRRPSHQSSWETYDGITLSTAPEGGVVASGGHLEGPQTLHDNVEILGASQFALVDRHENMVNVVGKRTSLGFLNHTLTQIAGVQDGVFWCPPTAEGTDVTRLAAFVVAPGLSAGEILQALRPHLDPVFLPRPVVHVSSLPRDGNGKLSFQTLQALAHAHFQTPHAHLPLGHST